MTITKKITVTIDKEQVLQRATARVLAHEIYKHLKKANSIDELIEMMQEMTDELTEGEIPTRQDYKDKIKEQIENSDDPQYTEWLKSIDKAY